MGEERGKKNEGVEGAGAFKKRGEEARVRGKRTGKSPVKIECKRGEEGSSLLSRRGSRVMGVFVKKGGGGQETAGQKRGLHRRESQNPYVLEKKRKPLARHAGPQSNGSACHGTSTKGKKKGAEAFRLREDKKKKGKRLATYRLERRGDASDGGGMTSLPRLGEERDRPSEKKESPMGRDRTTSC